MRYHWGLGVGHIHAHQTGTSGHIIREADTQDIQSPDLEAEAGLDDSSAERIQDRNSDVYDSDDPELCLDDREHEGWDDVESEGAEGGGWDDLHGIEEGENLTDL
jgi:hypothetical protein